MSCELRHSLNRITKLKYIKNPMPGMIVFHELLKVSFVFLAGRKWVYLSSEKNTKKIFENDFILFIIFENDFILYDYTTGTKYLTFENIPVWLLEKNPIIEQLLYQNF